MSVLYSKVLLDSSRWGGKDINVFGGSLNPNGVSSIFSSRTMRSARLELVRICPTLPLVIWETCLATLTVVGTWMLVVAALIVPGASWVSATRVNEAIKASLNVPLACVVKIWEIRSSIPEVTVDTLSVVPGTMFASCTDHSRLKASVGMHPPTKTARLCHTMKTTVKPPLTLASSNLRAILRGNGLIKQTAAKMIKTVSIRQNRKRRRRKLTGVFSLKSCGLDVLLSKPCSSSSLVGFFSSICCSPDVEILLMMRAAYEKGRTKNYVKISLSKAQVIYFLS